jgi:N-acetylglutamate synthase-like GNAT family acetyltransferase
VALVNLRDRHDERAVRELLRHATGSASSAERARRRVADRDWALVGWEEEGELAACAGVERLAEDAVELHAVAVVPARRGRGVGRALVDAVAAVINAPELVAETDDDAVGFYRRCGFDVTPAGTRGGRPRYRCVRRLLASAAPPASVRAPTLASLEAAIRASWGQDTSDDPDEWTPENLSRGQCVGTALLVRVLLGGEILIANVLRDGRRVERHAWNRLPSGLAVDLTRDQFRGGEALEAPAVGEPLTSPAALARYETLAARVAEALGLDPLGPATGA